MKSANKPLQLETIWRDYQQAIRAFLHSKVSNSDDVEDLQQEILLKTHQNLATLEDSSNIKSWLFQIANRTIIDFYRKRARQDRDGHLQADDLWFEESETDVAQELAQCISPFIQALPSKQAALLDAVELQGESQKALAERSGTSYSTLKSQVQKSRADLRALFEECCHLSLDKHGNVIDFQAKNQSCRNC
ncbi:RNA polymerase sigma factor SigZ [Vibrio profundi]|uniref:RNA polymerase sigma factor SigZ n=1 Tax=Vibrio profundi TaxID=1774960 RepID=UPI00373572FF